MNTSEKVDKIIPALLQAQAATGNVHRDAKNPHFRSTYASLESVINTVREPLTAAGIVILQSPTMSEGLVTVTTRLFHGSGQWVQNRAEARPADLSPQKVGSAVTYLRRYSLMSLLCLAPTDDDGNAAQGTPKEREAAASREEDEAHRRAIDRLYSALAVRGWVADLEAESGQALSQFAPADIIRARAWYAARLKDEKGGGS